MTGDSGLAAERTALAWSRTALAVFANAGLLALREESGCAGPLGLFAACFAALSAIAVVLACARRGRALRGSPVLLRISPRRQVLLVGSCVLASSLLCAFAATWATGHKSGL